jgi:hypothetical protein
LKVQNSQNQEICLFNIDFKNDFGYIDYVKLLAIISDLGYPQDAINLIGNRLSQSTTKFTKGYFGQIHPISI